jgi:hypothetical protein
MQMRDLSPDPVKTHQTRIKNKANKNENQSFKITKLKNKF